MNEVRLETMEYAPYYKNYVDLAGSGAFLTLLKSSQEEFVNFVEMIPSVKLEYAYLDGKWTIKEVLLHLIDSERVFQYRALRFARQDKTDLPGFDENFFVPNSFANQRSAASLIEEYSAVRSATITLFSSFSDDVLQSIGTANKSQMSVRAIAYVIVGHQNHHINVLRERYLKSE